MKRLLWVALACALFAVPSQAQSASLADASGGYSFLRIGGSNGVNLNGVSGSISYNANDWLGLVGDLGVYHGSPGGVGFTATTYTFGPRFTYRNSPKLAPFVQALFGGAHLAESFGGFGASSNPFAFSFGGGADVPLGSSDRVGLRPEFDYFGLRSNGSTSNSFRFSFALVYHIGAR